jgi:hypothetical protein
VGVKVLVVWRLSDWCDVTSGARGFDIERLDPYCCVRNGFGIEDITEGISKLAYLEIDEEAVFTVFSRNSEHTCVWVGLMQCRRSKWGSLNLS